MHRFSNNLFDTYVRSKLLSQTASLEYACCPVAGTKRGLMFVPELRGTEIRSSEKLVPKYGYSKIARQLSARIRISSVREASWIQYCRGVKRWKRRTIPVPFPQSPQLFPATYLHWKTHWAQVRSSGSL